MHRLRHLLLAACLVLTARAVLGADSSPFHKDPWLLLPARATEMGVSWQLAVAAPCTLSWGPADGPWIAHAVTREIGPDHLHRHVMGDLRPGTVYRYRVACGSAIRRGRFHTWPLPADTTLAFVVYGDTRSQPAVHDSVAAAILHLLDEAGDFHTLVISTGDLVAHGDRRREWDEEFFSLPHLQHLLSGVPLLPVRGNHERDGRLLHHWFALPDSGVSWYSRDVGPVHFTVVDQYREDAPGSPQYRWLEADLAGTDRRWKILLLHQPGWSAGGHHNTRDVQEFLQPLCIRYDVSLVLAGHNHYYARCVVDGVQHVTTGGGGAPLYTPHPDRPHVAIAVQAYHFCRVEVCGNELRFTAQALDGTVLDAFTLRR